MNKEIQSTVSRDRLKPHVERKSAKQEIIKKQQHNSDVIMDINYRDSSTKPSHTKAARKVFLCVCARARVSKE